MKFLLALALCLLASPLLAGEYANQIAIAAALAESNRAPKPVEKSVVPPAKAKSINWCSAAEAKAANEGALVYVHDHPHCPACVRLERDVFTDPRVIELMNRYHCVIVGPEDRPKWNVKEHPIRQYPWLTLVSEDWKIVGGMPFPSTADDMVDLLEAIGGDK